MPFRVAGLERWVMSFVYCSSSWKYLSWFTKGNVTGTKPGEGLRRQDGDRRAELCSAQVLKSGMRQLVSCAALMGFRLPVCWVWAGQFNPGMELESDCVMLEGVT